MKRFTCDELVESITAYLDDALDPPARAGFETHAACCDDCRRYVHQFRVTIRAVGDQPQEKLSGRTRERLMSAFKQRRQS
ncbi:zf-HC2 domain-containing protein [Nonomuraea sp. B5E05]|uniref:anti-sigma factor family protein n=1 Tax=Nonomuraea sp. B5E05 TaxID=3153569 RepID=UPI003260E6EF